MNATQLPLPAPTIQTNHIDGPLLHRPHGGLHWLTLRERIQLFFGLLTAESLEAKIAAMEAK